MKKTEANKYPYYTQCLECKYWRRLANGEKFTPQSKWSNRADQLGNLPACHYDYDTSKTREEKNGTCLSFKKWE